MIYRIDVRTIAPARGGEAAADPLGQAVRHQIEEFGSSVGNITTSRIFLIESESPRHRVAAAAQELLADPVVEQAHVIDRAADDAGNSRIEIHLKPGVMDPVAASTEMALRDMGIDVKEVRTGRAYLIEGHVPQEELERIASRVLANGVIESVHFDAFIPARFEAGREYRFELRHVSMRDLSDEQLIKLSREAHLFLSPAEMKAIRAYYREARREPTDIELETLAQTWSEHCVHKTLKSAVEVDVRDEAGKSIGKRSYKNLIKETIFASTQELMRLEKEPFCLSVFADNAGVIAFDETDAVCFKAETHNHPSAIEPYGGSATGAGGVIRDILGTGLAAKPIANTDVFCVAMPIQSLAARAAVPFHPLSDAAGDLKEVFSDPSIRHVLWDEDGKTAIISFGAAEVPLFNLIEDDDVYERAVRAMRSAGVPSVSSVAGAALPKGIIHPKRILRQVVAGVRDYGNRMGIPTVNGAVYFDDRYLGNPLVFCGCIGLIPRDKIKKQTRTGDAIVVMGGRTGRDGIHGATFSSAELTDTHADEFSHAVQIGNAITEKKMADVILQARDRGLFTAITDCGAGGLSSAVGEMGETLGAEVQLDKVPLKYAGLRYDEIWISEAQERMVLSVPADKLDALLALAASEDVEATVIGRFGTENQELILQYRGTEVGRLSMDFLHHGIPMPTRKAVVMQHGPSSRGTGAPPVNHGRGAHATTNPTVTDRLLSLLAHPNIASKHWIIRQYDHEVQGGSVIKPLTGPLQIGPSDAAVLRPKLESYRGIAIGCGLAPQIEDPYEMALAAIDEAIRNVVAVGADPAKIAILDNFCWPSVDDERTMGTLVRACEACRDAALAYGIPFISGKDSLHNQFTNSETGQVIRIPNTLLISAIGVIEDVRKCVTMDLKRPGNGIAALLPKSSAPSDRAALHRALAEAIRRVLIVSCHDCSEGGAAVAAAEMCIASNHGMDFGAENLEYMFGEEVGQYLIEFEQQNWNQLDELFGDTIDSRGVVNEGRTLRLNVRNESTAISVDQLRHAWRRTLDW